MALHINKTACVWKTPVHKPGYCSHSVLQCSCCPELASDIHQVRSMSHVRNGVLQVRQMMEQLIHQNRQCMELIEKQRSLIRGTL